MFIAASWGVVARDNIRISGNQCRAIPIGMSDGSGFFDITCQRQLIPHQEIKCDGISRNTDLKISKHYSRFTNTGDREREPINDLRNLNAHAQPRSSRLQGNEAESRVPDRVQDLFSDGLEKAADGMFPGSTSRWAVSSVFQDRRSCPA